MPTFNYYTLARHQRMLNDQTLTPVPAMRSRRDLSTDDVTKSLWVEDIIIVLYCKRSLNFEYNHICRSRFWHCALPIAPLLPLILVPNLASKKIGF